MRPQEIRKTIVAHRNDRMGARIISMLNAVRIAQDYGLPYSVGWTTGGRTHEECRDPTYIFDADYVDRHFFDAPELNEVLEDLIDLSTVGGTEEKFRKRLSQGATYLSGVMRGAIVLPWEDPDAVAAALPGCLDAFVFSPPVAAMIAEIKEMFAGQTLTAFHVRRGDIIHDPIASNKLWPGKYIPREYYELRLERLLAEEENVRVLIFSDTPEEVQRLKAMSDRVMGIDDLFGERDFTSGARDFLELYAMAQCKRIFGPPHSAYSQTAATIGGGVVQDVAESLSPEDRFAAMERMTERLEDRSPLFINDGDIGQSLFFLSGHLLEKGEAARAHRILQSYIDGGFEKSFVYQLFCQISAATGDLSACPRARDMAYARPVYLDESLAYVNAYSALQHLHTGAWDTARAQLHAGMWFRPLEQIVHGALCLGLTAGEITPANFFPFDDDLVRRKAAVFPQGQQALGHLNAIRPAGIDDGTRPLFHPWDIVVRDWRMIMGKKLNRAFSNKPKIARGQQMLERSFSKIEGSPALQSAIGVLHLACDDIEAAVACQRFAITEAPDKALYRKRVSDVLFAADEKDTAIYQLESAAEIAGDHPCYMAELGQRLWWAKRRKEAGRLFDRLFAMSHDVVEIHALTADMLRRDTDRLPDALTAIDRALTLCHGAQRLMAAKARILLAMDGIDEAFAIYRDLVDWVLGTEHTHAEILRQFSAKGRPELAEELTGRSTFSFTAIRAMVEKPQVLPNSKAS